MKVKTEMKMVDQKQDNDESQIIVKEKDEVYLFWNNATVCNFYRTRINSDNIYRLFINLLYRNRSLCASYRRTLSSVIYWDQQFWIITGIN